MLVEQIIRFVQSGDFGLGSGARPDGTFENLWLNQSLRPEDVTFDSQTFLILKDRARNLMSPPEVGAMETTEEQKPFQAETTPTESVMGQSPVMLRAYGKVPPELWNKLGLKLVHKAPRFQCRRLASET